jgi:hypothetical protein
MAAKLPDVEDEYRGMSLGARWSAVEGYLCREVSDEPISIVLDAAGLPRASVIETETNEAIAVYHGC